MGFVIYLFIFSIVSSWLHQEQLGYSPFKAAHELWVTQLGKENPSAPLRSVHQQRMILLSSGLQPQIIFFQWHRLWLIPLEVMGWAPLFKWSQTLASCII